METRKIGQLDVSVIGVGCNNFGKSLDAAATAGVIEAALDSGINFLDTADRYGGTLSEVYLGAAIGRHRDRVVLATKFGLPLAAGASEGASPAYVRTACEASLKRLNTDFIDLYQLHRPDPSTPIADTLGALGDLVREGKVREIGCSNFTAAQLAEAEAAVVHGAPRFVSMQDEYSLLERGAEAELLPECARNGVAFVPYYPLASGLLTGKYRMGAEPPANARFGPQGFTRGKFTEENLARAEALAAAAAELSLTLLQLAFSWLLSHREVASVIAGAMSPQQVRSNAAAYIRTLSPAEMAKVDAIGSMAT